MTQSTKNTSELKIWRRRIEITAIWQTTHLTVKICYISSLAAILDAILNSQKNSRRTN